jgi:casein kinase 1, epsilon
MAAGKAQLTTSVALPSSQWKNYSDSRHKGQFDAVHHNQGIVNITSSSNSWLPTFQHNAPGK